MTEAVDNAVAMANCLKTLPRKIKIGAYDWTVVQKEEDVSLCGQTHFDVLQIWLFPQYLTSPNHVAGILLHECLHVIFDNQGLGQLKRDKEDREEQIVMGFEAGLVSLFRDNPRFVNWTKKWLAG